MSLRPGKLACGLLVCGCAVGLAQQINIDFEAQCPHGVQTSGPCSTEFQFAGPQQTLTVPTSIGNVVFQGGVLLDQATFLPADETAVYSTSTGGGYSASITATFPAAVTNLYLTVINGVTSAESYTVSDNAGHSTSFNLPANTSSGILSVGFQVAGTVITISSSAPNWDFFIDNLSFSPLANSPVLGAVPGLLTFSTLADTSTPLEQSIQVGNGGIGTLSFSASVESGSQWVSISPSSGNVSAGSPVPITVTVNAQGLKAGSYRDVVQITSAFGSAKIPVTMFAANAGAIVAASPIGVLFNAVAGAGSGVTQNITIADIGSPDTTVNWSAGPVNTAGVPNGGFLAFSDTNGQAQPGNPANLALSLDSAASSLGPGVYYELVAISDQNSQNSPQYVTAVLNVVPSSSPVLPQISPAGLLFVGQVGRAIVKQQFTVSWSSAQAQLFQDTVTLPPGQNWLQADSGGSASSTNSATITVSVKPAGLSPGIYSGVISLTSATTGAALGAVNVTLILGSNTPPPEVSTGVYRQAVSNCSPSALVLTETGIPNNFAVPAGWPSNLVTLLADDCGNMIDSGSVAANFSNGDPPLVLTDQGGGGQYVATWQPSNLANTVVTLNGTAGKLKPALAQLAGVVTPNQSPDLFPNGIVNDFSFLAGGALSPAMVAAAFGSDLSTLKNGQSTPLPLPTSFQSTQLIMGGLLSPLYFVSQGQLNLEIPPELRPLQQYPAVGVVNGQLTLPVNVPVVPLAPVVDANTDGSVIAQDSNFALINANHPAHPGEPVVIYLVGMGATNPAVASGQPAPGPDTGLAHAAVQPVVQVNGETAPLIYAGLTPGFVGLYQINFNVPNDATAGNLMLTVSQGSVNANSTTLPVAVP